MGLLPYIQPSVKPLSKFVRIFAMQKMLHPLYAVVDSHFGDIQIVRNLRVTEAAPH